MDTGLSMDYEFEAIPSDSILDAALVDILLLIALKRVKFGKKDRSMSTKLSRLGKTKFNIYKTLVFFYKKNTENTTNTKITTKRIKERKFKVCFSFQIK